jgi:hypothetical protein
MSNLLSNIAHNRTARAAALLALGAGAKLAAEQFLIYYVADGPNNDYSPPVHYAAISASSKGYCTNAEIVETDPYAYWACEYQYASGSAWTDIAVDWAYTSAHAWVKVYGSGTYRGNYMSFCNGEYTDTPVEVFCC